jgi:anti-anti-sigma factor
LFVRSTALVPPPVSDLLGPFNPPPDAARVDFTVEGPTTRASVSGEIDLEGADGIEFRIRSAAEAADPTHLLVDLRGVTFMDSTGLRLLMSLHRHAREHGYRLTVVRPAPNVHRTIEIAGLHESMHFVDDPAEAAP